MLSDKNPLRAAGKAKEVRISPTRSGHARPAETTSKFQLGAGIATDPAGYCPIIS